MVITPYRVWIMQSPPVVPKLYWDAYSQEERIKKICIKVEGLERYLTYLSEQVANLRQELRAELIRLINEAKAALQQQMDELVAYIDEQVEELKQWVRDNTRAEGVWDVTTGSTQDSVKSMRRLFFDVTVHGTTVDELATTEKYPTVDALAQSGWNARALAVIGAYILDTQDDPTPWVVNPSDADQLTVGGLATTNIDADGYVYVPGQEG